MIISGDECTEQADANTVAKQTIKCLKETVPEDVPGCAFLSGGQSDIDATNHLHIMNEISGNELDWNLTFSYGRALQQSTLKAWGGFSENKNLAQKTLYNRAKCNSYASKGRYSDKMETELVEI